MIATPVVYHYEVELIEEPRPGVVQNEVVPAIELAINQALLPNLFECQGRDADAVEGSGSADNLSIRARQVDGSPIAGISANPDDIVDQDSEWNLFTSHRNKYTLVSVSFNLCFDTIPSFFFLSFLRKIY